MFQTLRNIKEIKFGVMAANYCVGERYSKPQKTYFAEDLIVKFLNDMVKENEYCIK